jgi:hypothetical protein
MSKEITAYNNAQKGEYKLMCTRLEKEIRKGLPKAEGKIWHRSPVWFLDGNPIVTYVKQKDYLILMFWSGQSFDEPELLPKGSAKFKAAEARYTSIDQIKTKDVQRWLKKGRTIQWDYKNIVKNKGILHRLK